MLLSLIIHFSLKVIQGKRFDWWWITSQGVMIAAITSRSHHPQRDFKCDTSKLVLSVTFQCCEQPTTMHSKEVKLDFKRRGRWLRDVMAAIITPCVVVHHQSVEYYHSPDSGDRLNKTGCGCSPDPFRCMREMGLGQETTLFSLFLHDCLP